VADLTPPGVEPHEYELSVRETAQVDEALVGFFEKGMAPSIDQAMTNDSPQHTLDVTSVVPLHAPEPGYREETANNEDPHFWQDPTLMAKAAAAFASTMAKADAAHAAYYRSRGAALVKDLDALDREYARTLRACRLRTLVVSHDAFEYLGRRYGLKILPIAGLSPEAEPSVKHIAELQQLIRSDQVTTVFSEVLASPKMSQTLASDLGLKTAVLDPIEGLSSSDAHANYLSIMKANLAAIERANSCT